MMNDTLVINIDWIQICIITTKKVSQEKNFENKPSSIQDISISAKDNNLYMNLNIGNKNIEDHKIYHKNFKNSPSNGYSLITVWMKTYRHNDQPK